MLFPQSAGMLLALEVDLKRHISLDAPAPQDLEHVANRGSGEPRRLGKGDLAAAVELDGIGLGAPGDELADGG